MDAQLPRRGDFVVGMSLAEIVLLLLFTVFVFHALEAEVGGGQDPALEVARLKEENDNLKSKLGRLERELLDEQSKLRASQKLIEELRNIVGGEGLTGDELKRRVEALKRGKPKCQDDNLLIEVVAIRGGLDVTVLLEDLELGRALAGKGFRLQRGERIQGESRIDLFLRAVLEYETQKGRDCRFDYRLIYATAEDYLLVREKFERFLYLAKRSRVS